MPDILREEASLGRHSPSWLGSRGGRSVDSYHTVSTVGSRAMEAAVVLASFRLFTHPERQLVGWGPPILGGGGLHTSVNPI